MPIQAQSLLKSRAGRAQRLGSSTLADCALLRCFSSTGGFQCRSAPSRGPRFVALFLAWRDKALWLAADFGSRLNAADTPCERLRAVSRRGRFPAAESPSAFFRREGEAFGRRSFTPARRAGLHHRVRKRKMSCPAFDIVLYCNRCQKGTAPYETPFCVRHPSPVR
jgi:hypothetical protein